MKQWIRQWNNQLTIFVLLVVMILAGIANGTVQATALPPKPETGIFVQDDAAILSSAEKKWINSLGSQLQNKTKGEVVVVTVKTLDGAAPEDYANELFRSWGIGDKQLNNGVLLLIALDDRKSRIEVGYGLEGALNDSKTGRIQDQYLVPAFKQGNYGKGIRDTYSALSVAVAQEYNVKLADPGNVADRQATASGQSGTWTQLPFWAKALIGFGLVLLIFIDFKFFGGVFTWTIISLFMRGRGGGGGRPGGGSSGGGGSNRGW